MDPRVPLLFFLVVKLFIIASRSISVIRCIWIRFRLLSLISVIVLRWVFLSYELLMQLFQLRRNQSVKYIRCTTTDEYRGKYLYLRVLSNQVTRLLVLPRYGNLFRQLSSSLMEVHHRISAFYDCIYVISLL